LRVYHFLKANHGIDDLRHRRLKIATIDRLNDPFEFLGVASKSRIVRRRYQGLKEGLSTYMGLICFSRNWRSPVQWAHYADHHRGLCLGFEISARADLREVTYAPERLKPNPRALQVEGDAAERHMLEILTTKFAHWSYEQEYRLFTTLKDMDEKTGFHWYDFSRDVRLAEVIIGPFAVIGRQDVEGALEQHEERVRIVQARLGFQKFEIVPQKNQALWR
jgi:hypothetical protein